jgi:hypothetical protein
VGDRTAKRNPGNRIGVNVTRNAQARLVIEQQQHRSGVVSDIVQPCLLFTTKQPKRTVTERERQFEPESHGVA